MNKQDKKDVMSKMNNQEISINYLSFFEWSQKISC